MRELAFDLASRDGIAALVHDFDKGPLLPVYGEPDWTEPVRKLLAVTSSRIIGWEIEAARILDLAPVNDMEMVERHASQTVAC
jgi:hypothetical protein